jgi:hypothetical protein
VVGRCCVCLQNGNHRHVVGGQRAGRQIAISTRRVAMCAHHVLEALVTALLIGIGLLGAIRRRLAYLPANARRPTVERDRRTGRLRAGFALMEGGR